MIGRTHNEIERYKDLAEDIGVIILLLFWAQIMKDVPSRTGKPVIKSSNQLGIEHYTVFCVISTNLANYILMEPTLFRILMFSMIPMGIFLLVKVIRMLKKTFNGKIIAEIPFQQKSSTFELPESGHYAIWQKGQLFRKTPIGDFKLQIQDESGTIITLNRIWFRMYKNGWETGRTELKKFTAAAGKFTLSILDQPDGNFLGKILDTLAVKPVDQSHYFIQIRESQPVYYFLIAIPLLTLSGFLIIIGMIAGIVGPQIAIDMGVF